MRYPSCTLVHREPFQASLAPQQQHTISHPHRQRKQIRMLLLPSPHLQGVSEVSLCAISRHCRALTTLDLTSLAPDPASLQPPSPRTDDDGGGGDGGGGDDGADGFTDASGYPASDGVGGGVGEVGNGSEDVVARSSGGGAAIARPVPQPLLARDVCVGLRQLNLDWLKVEPARVHSGLVVALRECGGLRRLSMVGYQGDVTEVRGIWSGLGWWCSCYRGCGGVFHSSSSLFPPPSSPSIAWPTVSSLVLFPSHPPPKRTHPSIRPHPST